MPTCSFCKKNYEIPRGITIFTIDGKTIHFCSSKCRRNTSLKRDPKKVNWVRREKKVKEQKVKEVEKKEGVKKVVEKKDTDNLKQDTGNKFPVSSKTESFGDKKSESQEESESSSKDLEDTKKEKVEEKKEEKKA